MSKSKKENLEKEVVLNSEPKKGCEDCNGGCEDCKEKSKKAERPNHKPSYLKNNINGNFS